MAQWVRGFVLRDTAELQLQWLRTLEHAERLERATRGTPAATQVTARLAELRRVYAELQRGFRTAAIDAAAQALEGMRQRFDDTQIRTATNSSPHLRSLLVAKPLSIGEAELGWVGVGLVSELNRAVNRNSPGYGTYWRAQEYGTGRGEVPSQSGRVIFGYFAGPRGGNAAAPDPQFRGRGGPHPIFMAMRPAYASTSDRPAGPYGTRIGPSGWGTIETEIAPRRFIRGGSDVAATRWREQIAQVQRRMIDELDAVGL